MRVSAHEQCATCYGILDREVGKDPEKKIYCDKRKVAVLMESYKETLLTQW